MAYTLKGRKGGTVRFTPMQDGIVDKETESYSSSVTSNAIENGSDLNDHVKNEAGTFAISGVIVGGEAAINALKKMRDSRDIITYTGKTRINNLVFTGLKFDYSSKNRDGATFTANFKRVQLVSAGEKATGQSMTGMDSGKSSNKQLAVTMNAGLVVLASQSVSAASLAKLMAAYGFSSSSAPLVRLTGGYAGLSD
ncbi:MAG: hypothetical protein IJ711_00225 [Lachnospiraceae bacterium]|nr:hypothetical protein [Clostridia bacterium]MBR1691181.1 hypothetical protein [Lachnospiraceae bacterium]